MKINRKALIICIAVPLAVGIIAGIISKGSMDAFKNLNKPALAPPGWLFPVVWTILFILMGIASYLILMSQASQKSIIDALKVYGVQLFFNFMWTILFFNFKLYFFSFIWLAALLVLIIITTVKFYKISSKAGLLMIPYIAWVSFAAYLNLSIALLNK
jgi:tryptophan-rich sensory protein